MTGVLLFIVLPIVLLVVGGLLIALFAGGGRGPDDTRRPVEGNFLDWML